MKKSKTRLIKLYELLQDIPFPIDGTGSKTASIQGYVTYQNDMRQVMPLLKDFLLACIAEKGGVLIEGEDYTNPDSLLQALEMWISARQSAQWSDQYLPIRKFIEQ